MYDCLFMILRSLSFSNANVVVGKIVEVYAKIFGKEVHYAAVVRDVLMYIEQFFVSEYGVDVSNLNGLLNKFEDVETFRKDPFGKLVCDIIEAFSLTSSWFFSLSFHQCF